MTSVVCEVEGGEAFYPSIYDGGDVFYFIGADIPLESGQHVTCIFLNERADLEEVTEASLFRRPLRRPTPPALYLPAVLRGYGE